jgi:hypothetical protein
MMVLNHLLNDVIKPHFSFKNKFNGWHFFTILSNFVCILCSKISKNSRTLQTCSVRMTRGYKRESTFVFVKGEGQSGVQSEWVWTTRVFSYLSRKSVLRCSVSCVRSTGWMDFWKTLDPRRSPSG